MKTLEEVAAFLLIKQIAFEYSPNILSIEDPKYKVFEVAYYIGGDSKNGVRLCKSFGYHEEEVSLSALFTLPNIEL